MTIGERVEVILMFSEGYMNWEIAERTNWPIKDIRETVSKACGYDEHLYLKHSGTYGKDNSPMGRQAAERIVRRIWG